MTADTETIRQAVNAGGVMAKIHGQSLEVFEAALAALGRVEEREAALVKALRTIEYVWDEGYGGNLCPSCGMDDSVPHDGSCLTARALSSAAGSGEE